DPSWGYAAPAFDSMVPTRSCPAEATGRQMPYGGRWQHLCAASHAQSTRRAASAGSDGGAELPLLDPRVDFKIADVASVQALLARAALQSRRAALRPIGTRGWWRHSSWFELGGGWSGGRQS
ncbi:hypothetical protein Vretimale_6108, partial [Volvox reticuliferus]